MPGHFGYGFGYHPTPIERASPRDGRLDLADESGADGGDRIREGRVDAVEAGRRSAVTQSQVKALTLAQTQELPAKLAPLLMDVAVTTKRAGKLAVRAHDDPT